MKRRIARKTAPNPKEPANKKSGEHRPRTCAHRFEQGAQMKNYLLEQHPELGQC
jgi:hypothetical protein